jgi:DNA-binding MarR family transcriptional regulator
VPKPKNTRLSVFKGREAKLNRAIFQVLAFKGPQTIYGIHAQVKTLRSLRNMRYANVNVRVRKLQESGYLNITGARKTKAGFEASIYDLAAKAYSALFLNAISLEELLSWLNEGTAYRLIGDIIEIMGNHQAHKEASSHRS